MAAVVTISAPYGTGGGIIGPAVAERLGMPFFDRAIPAAVAQVLAVPVDRVLDHDERAETRLGRVLAALAASETPLAPDPTGVARQLDAKSYRKETERVIHDIAQTSGGVILGRAAVMVLQHDPAALHVCLCGSFDRRVHQALAHSNDDEPNVRRLLKDTDRTRAAFFRHLYKADPDDSRLYHLVIDATVLDYDTIVDLIVTATQAKTGAAT